MMRFAGSLGGVGLLRENDLTDMKRVLKDVKGANRYLQGPGCVYSSCSNLSLSKH